MSGVPCKALALMILCATAAAAADGKDPGALSARQQQGMLLYEKTCAYCHESGGMGTRALATRLGDGRALLRERSDLSAPYIRHVVRRGLNNMPAYTPTDLTEVQIAAIASYLTRHQPPEATTP